MHIKHAAWLQAEAQCYIGSSDCPNYLKKAEKRLAEEIERVVNYLDPSSEAHITKVVENELIGKQVFSLINTTDIKRKFCSVYGIVCPMTH